MGLTMAKRFQPIPVTVFGHTMRKRTVKTGAQVAAIHSARACGLLLTVEKRRLIFNKGWFPEKDVEQVYRSYAAIKSRKALAEMAGW